MPARALRRLPTSKTYTPAFTSATASWSLVAPLCSTMPSKWPSTDRMMRPKPLGLSSFALRTVRNDKVRRGFDPLI